MVSSPIVIPAASAIAFIAFGTASPNCWRSSSIDTTPLPDICWTATAARLSNSLSPPKRATESTSAFNEPSVGSSPAERNFTNESVKACIANGAFLAMSTMYCMSWAAASPGLTLSLFNPRNMTRIRCISAAASTIGFCQPNRMSVTVLAASPISPRRKILPRNPEKTPFSRPPPRWDAAVNRSAPPPLPPPPVVVVLTLTGRLISCWLRITPSI